MAGILVSLSGYYEIERVVNGYGGPTSPLTNDLWKRDQCFSCGLHGHGVNRCSRLDITFPYVLPGWSVDVLDQYALSLQKAESRIIDNCLGPCMYPAEEVAAGALGPRIRRAVVQMEGTICGNVISVSPADCMVTE